jgi:segregation and condensation protein B
MDEYMTEEQQEILNEKQQEAEEEVQAEDVKDDTIEMDSLEEPENSSKDSDESDVSDLSDESDTSSEEIEDIVTPEDSGESDVSEKSYNSEVSDNIEKPEGEVTLESVIEAVLFASDEPLTPVRLANITESTTKQVRDHIKNLNEKYEANNNSFRIEQIAGGLQMLTLSQYNYWLKKLLRARSETKLSPAAMETLAIIAYKQPVIRADIEAIRGVAVGEVIRSLSYKGLVKIVGRAEILGRPMLYGTTKKFLEVFGLNTLKDLPKIEELKRPPN